jgi:hypothetical protein
MSKFIIPLLSIASIHCLAMGNDNVSAAAQKFVNLKDYYETAINDLHGKDIKITSFFDLSKNSDVLKKSLTPDAQGNYDLRNLEVVLCRLAQANQKSLQKHRGKIGLTAGLISGIVITSGICLLQSVTNLIDELS